MQNLVDYQDKASGLINTDIIIKQLCQLESSRKMKTERNSLLILLLIQMMLFTGNICTDMLGQESKSGDKVIRLNNPVITAQFIKTNLRKSEPRLVLTPAIESKLKSKLRTDPVVKNYYATMKLNASQILKQPELTRVVIGRRLLSTSREMLYRMTLLSMVYRIDKNPDVLNKIDREINAVCNFKDWNPSHFLDVAEMSLAVAIAVDWTGSALPKSTVELARTALIDKGIKPGFSGKNDPGWVNGTNNWNQVCNGGMIAAAIVIAGKDPELAARTINRSLNGMSSALKQYAPNGVYPEGATYWNYGTSFSVVTSSILESAFGTDFGIAAYPAFMESAVFRLQMVAPSGWYFNFADCGDKTDGNGDILLAWFASRTGNLTYLEREKFLKSPESFGKLSRLSGPGLVWLSQFEEKTRSELPLNWKGDGENPLVIFRGGSSDKNGYYFGGKGGRANLSHGNMDAGSFVFEINGVRWAVDPGNQDYNELEQAGFDLWGTCQDCERWSLMTKGNQGHGTLTVNDNRFIADATAPIIDFKTVPVPEARVDLTPVYGQNLQSALRRFIKDTDHSIIIEDQIVMNEATESLTWALMTTADVTPTADGVTLSQEGKTLNMNILSPTGARVSTIMMDPPPMKFDRKITGLKRIEIRIPAYTVTDKKLIIKVRLTSPE